MDMTCKDITIYVICITGWIVFSIILLFVEPASEAQETIYVICISCWFVITPILLLVDFLWIPNEAQETIEMNDPPN